MAQENIKIIHFCNQGLKTYILKNTRKFAKSPVSQDRQTGVLTGTYLLRISRAKHEKDRIGFNLVVITATQLHSEKAALAG